MSDHIVLGLDLSLACTGWARVGGVSYSGVMKPKKIRGVVRLAWFEEQVKELVRFHKPTLAVIENYAFGAQNQLAQLGELGGLVRLILHKLNVPFIEVPPTTLKKFVTSKGNAEKNAMMLWCFKNWGMEFSDNNEADAFSLAKFGECFLCRDGGFRTWQVDVIDKFEKELKK